MRNQDFVHLHIHSEYSLLDGLGSGDKYASRAVELGFKGIGIADHGSIDGHMEWQKACKKAKIKPIFGAELYVVNDIHKKEKGETKGHMIVLVKNFDGWKSLARMLTIGHLEGFYNKPRIDEKIFWENVNDGMIVMTACAGSFLLLPDGEAFFKRMVSNGVDCYLEVMPHCIKGSRDINHYCSELSREVDVPLIATNDCHYVNAQDSKAQEVLLAVQRSAKWKDKDRWRFDFDGIHLRTADEMIGEFKKQGVLSRSEYTKAMINTMSLAEKCWGFEIKKREISLPETRYERMGTGEDSTTILGKFCRSRREYSRMGRDYLERYERELKVIGDKNFARYFLIVYELVQWCKQNGIMVGPGRGSVGGSLIAYMLGITQVDPLKYDLLFERFISEDRIDYPDIDLDFEDVKCHLVRKHLEEEYGEFNVAGISTFLVMKGRSVIRDVGRVFELSVSDIDEFAKSIRAREHDESIIVTAGKESKEGQRFVSKYPEQFDLACTLEGTIRGAGQHAAGLIISGRDLRTGEGGNLCRRADTLVCNWDMDWCEYNGLIKIDVLKLGTLTVLNEARRLIEIKGEHVDYESLDLGDRAVFDMLSKGDTIGVFQFTGYACTDLCVKMGIDCFEDMIAVTALARPGPADSGMTDQYVERKHGASWVPLHPAYEAITRSTYGVIVYQEQMMRAMTDLAGFSKADADRIRKVIGKKRTAKEFEPYREAFLKGCVDKKTLNPKQAGEFWEGLMEWAHYGFVRAHAVEYAMIGYWTAWLKVYYPTEFLCAQLTYGLNKEDTVKDAERMGMTIVTPKVGMSDARRWISSQGKLYMPFVEIKGVGEAQAEKCSTMKIVGGNGMRRGFFDIPQDHRSDAKGKLEKLMVEIEAFNPDPQARPENLLDYFSYSFSGANQKREEIEIIKRRMTIDVGCRDCHECGLRGQAGKVVPSSLGMYNSLILGEAPGREEDKEGRGFVGDAGTVLWDELATYGITRRMIHCANSCKCWPSRSRTPSKDEIDKCFSLWTRKEIRSMDCRLILATGNIPLYALTGKSSGITSLAGQMEWVERVKSWVIWCVHPSAVLRNRRENMEPFQKGIAAFANALKEGGKI